MKTLADLDYGELLARAAAVTLPPLADADPVVAVAEVDSQAGDAPDFGMVAVAGSAWLRDRATPILRGLPELPEDPADDIAVAVLLQALSELDEELGEHLRAWDPGDHKRWPKGHPKAGAFRPMIDLVKEAIQNFDGKGKPLDNFSRPQLLKVAKERNIGLERGEDKDSVAAKILADLGVPAVPAKKAAAKAAPKKATAKAAPPPTFDDGLDALDERDLKDLAAEYDLDNTKSRNDLLTTLRALGAVSPVIGSKRRQARGDLDDRLKNLGRRQPADSGPLDRAANDLAEGKDVKAVAKQLRTEASIAASKEDADTLRFLANDLTKRKATIPEYINDKGNIDLIKLGEMNGIDIKRWMPSEKRQHAAAYFDANPFDGDFRPFVKELATPEPGRSRARVIREMRARAEGLRTLEQRVIGGTVPLGYTPGRAEEKKRFLAAVQQVIADLEQLADLAEAAKVPAKKRAQTLGATTLGEVVPVDESRFASRPIKAVLKHRGEAIPKDFAHTGSGTALVLAKKPPRRTGLSVAENRALDLYTVGVVADGINGSLRKGQNVHGYVKGPSGELVDLDEVSRHLDAALADSKLTEDTILWRGALPSTADYRRLIPGAIYTDHGYMSTSAEEKGARQTINWRQSNGTIPPGRKPVIFKILAPAGTNAALGHERVKEALLPRGQELRVVRVDETVAPPVVVMEVVPPHTDPGVVRGRSLVDDFDYDTTVKTRRGVSGVYGSAGRDGWLGEIQKAQGFDGKPTVVSRQELDRIVSEGGTQLFRGLKPTDGGGKLPAKLAEQFRSGEFYPGTGVYGSGTYSTPDRDLALRYGGSDESGLLRIALRRDARVIRMDELEKLRPRTGITASASKLADDRQAELNAVDPTDTKAVEAIIEKYEALSARQGSRSRVAADAGRVAALLGYDAILVPPEYRGPRAKQDGNTEYVILNRTATYVEEAQQ